MKKSIFFASMALLFLATACSDDDDYEKNTLNVDITSEAVVMPLNGYNIAPQFITDFQVRVTQNMYEGWAKLHSLKSVNIDGQEFSFTTPETNTSGDSYSLIVNPMQFTAKNGQTVNLKSEFTTKYYYYNVSTNQAITNPAQTPGSRMIASISVDDKYVIRTFQKATFFAGTTVTTINGQNPYSNPDILYNVNLDLTNRTATVIFYNAKFAEPAPVISKMRLRNLVLEPDAQCGYRISGENVVPEVQEGDSWIPNTNYTFTSFSVTPASADLTKANIVYQVGNAYHGECLGSYTYSEIPQN